MRAPGGNVRLATLAVLAGLLCAAPAGSGGAVSGAGAAACPRETLPRAEAERVLRVLRSGRDVWGERLLASPGGPTYAAAASLLRPVTLARAARGASLTDSGFYYVPFGVPAGAKGSSAVALHVADGSQIVSRRAGGPSLTVRVGPDGAERYGSCTARLSPARLADGWLPVLRTAYVDAAGARYAQESFAARAGAGGSLASFVRLAVDARRAQSDVTVRLVPSPGAGERLLVPEGEDGVWRVPRGEARTVHAVWLAAPGRGPAPGPETHEAALRGVASLWRRLVARGMQIDVPEPRVANAARALKARQLLLTWRYSVGNQYEQFSFPEGVDAAQTLAEQGFPAEAREALLISLGRPESPYPNWRRGMKLLGFAAHWRLHRDGALVARATPALRRYVDELARQLERSPNGLLDRERYSSDIPDAVYGLHSQATAWAGLRAMASVWRRTGRPGLAARCGRLATRLERGLRTAIARSQKRLPDGSLFVPARLLDDERAYRSVTEERLGSYWNLVMPYAFATGLLPPGSAEARGVLRYLERHGAWLLGVVRAGAYSLYERPSFPVGGVNPVYGLNLARFLADNDEAARLVLALYGQLGAAMTPHTFVSGEAVSVAPLRGTAARATYLPPNGAAASAFLTTLRAMLVHETRDRAGEPLALRLAYATPRAWLRPGARIAVRRAPTSFGPVSFSIASQARGAAVVVEAPRRARPRALSIRLRLPPGLRIGRVELGGRPYGRVDRATGTIDLSGRTGTLRLAVVYRRVRA